MEIKKNWTVIVFLMISLFWSLNTLAETKEIHELNRFPLMKISPPGIKNVDDFKALVEKYADRIKAGFEKTDEAWLYDNFMMQVRSGNIEERIIPHGQYVKWMLFYSNNQTKVAKDVEWAGKTIINAYVITVLPEQECKKYEFLIPKVCGNICLVEGPNEDVICNIELSPKEAQIGECVTVDMSGSKCAATYDITVSSEGKPIKSKKLTNGEKSWQTTFNDPGTYEISALATSNGGITSKNECQASIHIGKAIISQEQPVKEVLCLKTIVTHKVLYFMAEAGPMFAKGTYTGYIFARLGFAFFIIPEKFSLTVSGGYAFNLGSDLFKNHFLSNSLLNVHFKKFFVGGGFGFSSKVRNAMYEDGTLRPEWKSDIDIVGNVGYEIFSIKYSKSFIFGEIRIPIHKGLEFKKDHALLLGFRVLI